MIELPEAMTIARQMNETLRGKRIAACVRGNTPHKFAFYSGSPEEYAAFLNGKMLGEAEAYGPLILVAVEPEHVLVFGDGGERILFHRNEKEVPKKHQFLLQFEDETYLSVTVQGWGHVNLLPRAALAGQRYIGAGRITPLSDAFTFDDFAGLFAALGERDARAIKYFIISEPGIWGVRNGYLQDILFRARIHPRRRAATVNQAEQRVLYAAIDATLRQATAACGRRDERDLYNHAGGYERILDSASVGRPCPVCGAAIEKIMFLGGASYFCPQCQI